MVIQSHYVIDSLRLDMKWEYAALEKIRGSYPKMGPRENEWPEVNSGWEEWWVLRSDRSMDCFKLNKNKSWKGALYANKDPFLLFMEVAKEGWEMTSSIPVSLRVHFNGEAPLGGYNMMPMMRRRLKE